MKRFLFHFIVVGFFFAISVGKVGAVQANNHPVLQIAVLEQFPYVMIDDDKTASGILVSQMRYVAKKAGYRVEFISMPSAGRLLSMVKKGKIDAAISVFKSESRAKKYIFSAQPLYQHRIFVINEQADYPNGIKKLDDMAGRIGYVRDFYLGPLVDAYLKQLPERQQLRMILPANALVLLQKERIQHFITDMEFNTAKRHMLFSCYEQTYVASEISRTPSFILWHKGEKQQIMAQHIDQMLKKLSQSGRTTEIIRQYWENSKVSLCSGFEKTTYKNY